MIRLALPQALAPDLRYAVSVLADASRLLPAEVPEAIEIRTAAADGVATRLDAARHIRVVDGAVEIAEDALRLVVRVAGAVDEQRSTNSDRHGRVPPSDNYLVVQGLERQPVLSRFALELRAAAVAAAGRRLVALAAPWPQGKRWAVAMTHDLDVVAMWPAFTALRALELAGKGRVADLLSSVGAALAHAAGDPVWSAARHVLDVERRLGIRSTWFIITGTPTVATRRAGDVTYQPESAAARRIIDAVHSEGHEIGLHGSFETGTHAERFAAQKARLERIVGRPVTGVRQHFIRMRPGATHEAMRASGFRYDSTFGFADRNGFRLGHGEPLPVWSEALQRPLAIDAVPFVWMDRALSKYRAVENPKAWVEDALDLARVCREVEGLWTGIWHPNLSTPLGFPGAERAFEDLCTRLLADVPWAATLDEIVGWRVRRRAAKALGVGPSGEIILASDASGMAPIDVEDAQRRPLRVAAA